MTENILRGNGKLFPLGIGCMRLPTENKKIQEDIAREFIYYGINNGINYIDTAYLYHNGESERFLGKILQGEYRDKINLSTKLPSWLISSRSDMDKFLNEQLNRLKTDHVEYYYIHSVDYSMLKKLMDLGLAQFIEESKANGKIKNIGFSYHGSTEEFTDSCDLYDWDCCLIQYNYLDRHIQAGTKGLKYAHSKGMDVVIMEPLKGGLLAGNMPTEVEELFKEIDSNKTNAQWAFYWVLNHPEVTCVLSGMGSMDEIKENIHTATNIQPNSLNKTELNTINKVQEIMHNKLEISCTSCGYCKPCPFGVDIPECFRLYNEEFLFDDSNKGFLSSAKMTYYITVAGVIHKPSHAGKCINCRQCVSKCPQNIMIPQELKKVSKKFEGHGFGFKVRFLQYVCLPLLKLYENHSTKNNNKD